MTLALAFSSEKLVIGKVNAGTAIVCDFQVRFTMDHKLLSLFSSIIEVGRSTLVSTGIFIISDRVSYERAMHAFEKILA